MISCQKEVEDSRSLPALTNQGIYTLGCKVNGEIWIANSGYQEPYPIYTYYFPETGQLMINATMGSEENKIIEQMYLMSEDSIVGVGTYAFTKVNENGLRKVGLNNVYSEKSCPNYYHDSAYKSVLNITYLDSNKRIVSGTFELDLINAECDIPIVKITEGRFDVRY